MQPNSASALAKIRSKLPALAASETRVANWVLQHAHEVVRLSMAQVAHECGVSDTTVLRFCRSAGFYGFMDLKLSIARDSAQPTQIIHGEISEDDDIPTVTRKVFMSNIAALQDTLEMMDMAALSKAVELLLNARRILIIGVGTSAPIVQDMFNKLFRLGLNCRAQTDSYLQLMDAALLQSGDVMVGISQSGSSADPILTMETAKANGAATICITGNAQSSITEQADVTLLSIANETRAESISSRIAQITIIDALYIIMSLHNIEQTVQNERKIWDSVLPKTV